MENHTGLPAHEFGNRAIDSLPLPNHWNPPQKAIAFQIDYLKLVIWIVGAFLPWAGFAALLVSG
jgi:hypothetical protein